MMHKLNPDDLVGGRSMYMTDYSAPGATGIVSMYHGFS